MIISFRFIIHIGMVIFLCLLLACSISTSADAVLFDMDGVLIDTEHSKYEAWHEALKKTHGIDLKLNEYIPWIGFSSKDILDKILVNHKKFALTPVQKKEVISLKKQIYHKKKQTNNQPILPAVNFLKDLINKKHSYGIKVGIVSSASRQEIRYNLKLIGIDPSKLDGIASGSDDLADIYDPTGTNKPKSYIYQKIANILNIKPERTIVFEDTQAGVNAAFLAGMRVYAVPNIYTKQHDFINSYEIIEFEHNAGVGTDVLLQTGYFKSKNMAGN